MISFVFLISFVPLTDNPADAAATIDYLRHCRRSDGGYSSSLTSTESTTLTTTSAALRALKHFGKKPEELAQTKAYVWSCFRKLKGEFGDQPGATPNYRTTAAGVMALVALGDNFSPAELSRIQLALLNSDQPEDLRLGAAAIEALMIDGQLLKVPNEWQPLLIRAFKNERQPDGTYGQGPGKARMTAGYAAALLRLGFPIEEKQKILDLLKESQHPSGGWTDEKGQPDLESTYRVMRCLYLLRCKDVGLLDRCQKFIASCRQSDGGYGIKLPTTNAESKQPSSISSTTGTYFSVSILHWLDEMRK